MGKSLENFPNFPKLSPRMPSTSSNQQSLFLYKWLPDGHRAVSGPVRLGSYSPWLPYLQNGRQVNVTWLVVIFLQNLNKKTFNDRSEVFLFFHRKPSSLLIFSHLPVGILLNQRATVNWDGDILHAVILFLVGCLKAQVGICQQKSKSSELSSGLQFYWTLKKMKTFPVCECAVNSTYTASIKGKLHCFSPICNPVKPEP